MNGRKPRATNPPSRRSRSQLHYDIDEGKLYYGAELLKQFPTKAFCLRGFLAACQEHAFGEVPIPFRGPKSRQELYHCVKVLKGDPKIRPYVRFEPNGRGTGVICHIYQPPLPEAPRSNSLERSTTS
jgi:hypothetical protein